MAVVYLEAPLDLSGLKVWTDARRYCLEQGLELNRVDWNARENTRKNRNFGKVGFDFKNPEHDLMFKLVWGGK